MSKTDGIIAPLLHHVRFCTCRDSNSLDDFLRQEYSEDLGVGPRCIEKAERRQRDIPKKRENQGAHGKRTFPKYRTEHGVERTDQSPHLDLHITQVQQYTVVET